MAVLILVCWALAFGNVVLCFKLRLYLTAVSILGTVALYMGIVSCLVGLGRELKLPVSFITSINSSVTDPHLYSTK